MYCFIKYAGAYVPKKIDVPVQRKVSKSASIIISRSVSSRFPAKSFSNESPNKILIVNPDCYIQILIDYICEEVGIEENVKFDLANENGDLIDIKKRMPYESAKSVLQNKCTYVIVIYELDALDNYLKLEPLLNLTNRNEAELFSKIVRKQFGYKAIEGSKSSKSIVTRTQRSASGRKSGRFSTIKLSKSST